jgi:DNA polymerase-1
MQKIIFDIESTGFLRRGSQIHCIVTRNLDNPDDYKVFDTVQNNVDEGVEYLQSVDRLVGHNIASYDIPLLWELYPNFKPPEVIDTLILSRLFFSTLLEQDFENQYQQRKLPKAMYGKHSLKAWGLRLGQYKGDFAETNDWSTYSDEMRDYCLQDCLVNYHLYLHLIKFGLPFYRPSTEHKSDPMELLACA